MVGFALAACLAALVVAGLLKARYLHGLPWATGVLVALAVPTYTALAAHRAFTVLRASGESAVTAAKATLERLPVHHSRAVRAAVQAARAVQGQLK